MAKGVPVGGWNGTDVNTGLSFEDLSKLDSIMPRFQDITIAGTWSMGEQSKIEGNLIPDSDDNRDLGSATNRYRNLHLKGDVNFSSKAANAVFSGPASGADASPAFRALVDADIPNTISLDNLTQITTRNHSDLAGITSDQHHAQAHVLATTAGLGTDHSTSGLTAGQVLRATGATAAAFQSLNFSDLAGTATDAQIPNTISLDNITQITSRAISDTTGTLAVSRGGTGQTAQTAAFNALDPLTTQGDIVVRDATNSVRLPVGTNDQVLTADSAQASGVKWAAAGGLGYTLQGHADNLSPADATTYFWGSMFSRGQLTTASRSNIYIPLAGNITLFRLFVWVDGTLASAGTVNHWLRLNDTTDNLNIQLSYTSVTQTGVATGSVAVVAGDFIQIKNTMPTWVTNPTLVRVAAVILIE